VIIKNITSEVKDMNKFKKLNFLIFFLILLLYSDLAYSHFIDTKKVSKKPSLSKVSVDPEKSLLNINNVTMWVGSDGFHDWVVGGSWNGAFPNGSSVGAIFAEGIVWGGLVDDGNLPVVRVNGNTYGTGCYPLIRLFRVRPDYKTGI